MPIATPWTLRAWPPLMRNVRGTNDMHFEHLSTRVTSPGDRVGQTMWGSRCADGECGVAWDWVELPGHAVAMADPMAVVTNIRLLGDTGEVLTAQQAALYLNEIVHALPWQEEVQRVLRAA